MAHNNFHIPIPLKDHCLNPEETRELIIKAQSGCIESRDIMVERNLKLVINVVRRFKGKEDVCEDLFQIGSIGLLKAINNFDIEREVKFSTYAVPTILGEIRRYLRDNNTIKVSRTIQENTRKIRDFHEKYVLKYEREPKMSEIVENLKMDIEDVAMAMGSTNEIISFSKTNHEDNGDKAISLEDKLKNQKCLIQDWIEKENIREAFDVLNDKEKNIIEMRFFNDKTQQEVGEELGISQAHVSRIEKNALIKLRKVI